MKRKFITIGQDDEKVTVSADRILSISAHKGTTITGGTKITKDYVEVYHLGCGEINRVVEHFNTLDEATTRAEEIRDCVFSIGDEEEIEIGMEKVEVPEGYFLKPVPRSAHMHILVQEPIKEALTKEAKELKISKNELINRIFAERYMETSPRPLIFCLNMNDSVPRTRKEWDDINKAYDEIAKLGKVFLINDVKDFEKMQEIIGGEANE